MSEDTYDQEGLSFPIQPPSSIPADHPLKRLFQSSVERTFVQTLGVYDSEVTDYLAQMLTEFTHVQHLHKIKSLAGRPLTEVADMLMEADLRLNAKSFNREREVHKHIGDYTMFWAGIFPEALPRLQASMRKDHLIDYIKQGKSSYAIAATHDYGDYRSQAPVLQKLSQEFELCLFGLNKVRTHLDQLKYQN